jgi:hypothetical protein
VFTHLINWQEIDKAIAPPGMNQGDRVNPYNAAVDVPSISGGWMLKSGDLEHKAELHSETQRMADMTATLLASTTKDLNRVEIRDTTFNSVTRHSMGKVSTRQDCMEFAAEILDCKEESFRQQDDLLELFMTHRGFDEREIDEYIQTGLLGHLIHVTFDNYNALACTIRQLALDFPRWEAGPAKAMLEYHSRKLLMIRKMSVSRKH